MSGGRPESDYGARGMKEGRRCYGKKHERKEMGRWGRKGYKAWLRANHWRLRDEV